MWIFATASAAPPNFIDDVLPIFKEHCLSCHNPDKKKADLDLSTTQTVQIGSSGGEIVKPGVPDTSVLFMVIDHHEDFEAMPPKKPKLPEAQLKTIHAWIAEGLLETADGKSQLREMSFDVSSGSAERPENPAMPTSLPEVAKSETRVPPPVVAMAVSPWADVVAASGHEQIFLLGKQEDDSSKLTRLGILPFPEGTIHDLRFSRNGDLLVAAGGMGAKSGKAVLFDVKTGKRKAEIGDETDVVLSADVSANHQFVAIGTPLKMVKIFSTQNGKLLHRIEKHTDWVTVVRFSPDGKLLATADRNGGIHVWETETGGIVYTLDEHKVRVTALSWRPDGKVLASAGEDGKFVLWDMKDGWPTRTVKAHEQKAESRYSRRTGILDLSFGRDGQIVTTGRDRSIRWWKADGAPAGELKEFESLPLQVGYSPSFKRVYLGDLDGQVHAIDLEQRKIVDSRAP
ncbi:MAG: hypothetical protein HKN23_11950 [Verrucomicrobiales bacterium]|nr:hypothetical protein [Verrucomicrobiales bacterium]